MTLNFQVFEGLICLQIQDGNSADWLPPKFELLSQLTKQNKERMLNLDKICRFQSESNSIMYLKLHYNINFWNISMVVTKKNENCGT